MQGGESEAGTQLCAQFMHSRDVIATMFSGCLLNLKLECKNEISRDLNQPIKCKLSTDSLALLILWIRVHMTIHICVLIRAGPGRDRDFTDGIVIINHYSRPNS